MNNTLLIHIGMPKTGTTALQNFLLQNDEKLKNYGWCYPVLNMTDIEECGNAYGIYESLILKKNQQEWDEGIEIALKHLENMSVILSTEGIFIDGIDQFITGVKKKHNNIKVIVYLRRQDREIESLYNQYIKIGTEYDTFDKFIESDKKLEKWLSYLSKLDSISRIIGKENLIVRVYEKQQMVGNDIIADFLSVLGISLNQEEWKKSAKMNPSLEGNYLEIKRLVNTLQKIEGLSGDKNNMWRDIQAYFYDVCVGLSHSYHSKKEYGFFTKVQREAFLGKFVAENAQIAQKYLHRENGILFYDDREDYPTYTMKRDDGFEADMIRMFAMAIYMQKQEMKSVLGRKSAEILGKVLMKDILQRRRDRKILIFGAGHNCRRLFDFLGDIPATMIADNDMAKDNTVVNGVQVRHPKFIENCSGYFIVVTCAETDEIEEQLCGFGLKKGEDYLLMKEYGL